MASDGPPRFADLPCQGPFSCRIGCRFSYQNARNSQVFRPILSRFSGLVLAFRNATVLLRQRCFLLVVDVMAIFEEWFEYDYEEVLLGAVKAETKRKGDELLALRLRHRRSPTRPQK
jgi:hypothetical protein